MEYVIKEVDSFIIYAFKYNTTNLKEIIEKIFSQKHTKEEWLLPIMDTSFSLEDSLSYLNKWFYPQFQSIIFQKEL